METLKSKFGKRLRELRKNKGFTQEQLAEIVSIEPPNLSKIECGMHFPQPEKIEKIASALNIEIAELFCFEHFNDNSSLLAFINDTISTFDSKRVEFVYKMVDALKLLK